MDERKEIQKDSLIEVSRKLTRKEVIYFIKTLSNLQPIPNSTMTVEYQKTNIIEILLELL